MSESLAAQPTHDILHLAAMSLSAAPNLSEAERTARSGTVIRGAMEFQPADTAQTVLASLILGHHLAIMDGFRDIACLTLTPAEAARARMVTVAQTKLVLQLLREMRAERKEALTLATADAAAAPANDTAYEASLTQFMSAYAETLATLKNTDPLTPAAAAKAREVLGQATRPVQAASTKPVPAPVTGSRAQRRAMMKRNGGFKRTA